MSPSFNGIKLNELVNSISTSLNSIQKDTFLNKLGMFGYDFSPEYNNLVYTVTDKSSYLVETDFPRIIRQNIPIAIAKVQYDLILSDLIKYKQ